MTLTARGGATVLAGTLAVIVGVAFSVVSALALGGVLLAVVGLALGTRPPPDLDVTRVTSARVTREGLREDTVTTVRVPAAWRGRHLVVTEDVPASWDVDAGARHAALAPRASEVTVRYAWRARVPGRHDAWPVRVRVTDAFGLVAHARSLDVASPVTVYPRVDALPAWPVGSRAALARAGDHATGQSGLGASFHAIRDYQDGDTMRDVNWRATARTGGTRMLVNEREKDSHAAVTLFVDARAVAGEGTRDVNAWVLAVRAVAHLAAGALKRRDHPRVVVYGGDARPRVVPAAPGDPDGLGLLDACLDAPPAGNGALADAVRGTLKHLKRKSATVIVSHLHEDASWPDAVQALRALDQHVTVIAIRAHACHAAAGAADADVAAARDAHAARVTRLRAHGCRVIDWDPADAFPLAVLKEASA